MNISQKFKLYNIITIYVYSAHTSEHYKHDDQDYFFEAYFNILIHQYQFILFININTNSIINFFFKEYYILYTVMELQFKLKGIKFVYDICNFIKEKISQIL